MSSSIFSVVSLLSVSFVFCLCFAVWRIKHDLKTNKKEKQKQEGRGKPFCSISHNPKSNTKPNTKQQRRTQEDGMFGDFFEQPDEGVKKTVESKTTDGAKPVKWQRPPVDSRKENFDLVGLLNQGTTCYLNSLLQTLYMSHSFRRRIYDLSDAELGSEVLDQLDLEQEAEDEKNASSKDSSSPASGASGSVAAPTPPKDEFRDDPLYQPLIDMFKETGFPQFHVDSAIRCCDGNLSDREALFMWLLDNPTPDNAEELQAEYEAQHKPAEPEADGVASSSSAPAAPKQKYRRIPIRLRQLFSRLQIADCSAISTQQLTLSFGWKGNHLGVQHDITELNRVLMDAIHRSLAGTAGSLLVTDLFEGVFVNKLSLFPFRFSSS